MTIAILNSKGGVGKTTITTTLAGTLQERGYAVLLVDADPQGSAVAWHHRRAEAERKSGHLACVQITRTTLDRDLASTNADYVVIDGSARLEKLSVSAIKAADVVLIPVQPSVLDLWDVSGTAALVKARQQAHGALPRRLLWSVARSRVPCWRRRWKRRSAPWGCRC